MLKKKLDNRFGCWIKGYSSMPGHDGVPGFDVTVTLNGMPLCHAHDDGNGGGTLITPVNKDCKAKLDEIAAKWYDAYFLPANPDQGEPKYVGKDEFFIEFLVDTFEQVRLIKRHCSKKTCFSLEGDEPGVIQILKYPFGPKVVDHLKKTYGSKLVEIFNETLAEIK